MYVPKKKAARIANYWVGEWRAVPGTKKLHFIGFNRRPACFQDWLVEDPISGFPSLQDSIFAKRHPDHCKGCSRAVAILRKNGRWLDPKLG